MSQFRNLMIARASQPQDWFKVRVGVKGRSIVWNQMLNELPAESWAPKSYNVQRDGNEVVYTYVGSGEKSSAYAGKKAKVRVGNTVLVILEAKTSSDNASFSTINSNGANHKSYSNTDEWRVYSVISRTGNETIRIGVSNVNAAEVRFRRSYIFDLTTMFPDGIPASIVDADTFAQALGYDTFDEIPEEALRYNDGTIVSVTPKAVESTGRNLWDEDDLQKDTWINISGIMTQSRLCDTTQKIRCTSNEKVFFKAEFARTESKNIICISFRDNNDNNIGRYVDSGKSQITLKAVAPAETKYVRFAHYTSKPTKIMVGIGDAPNIFVPYRHDEIDFSDLTNEDMAKIRQLFPDGLKSADSVRDEIVGSKAIKRVGGIVVKNQSISRYSERTYFVALTEECKFVDLWTTTKAINNSAYTNTYANNSIRNSIASTSNNRFKITTENTYETKEEFIQSEGNIEIYYELETPIEIELSAPLSLKVGHGGSIRMTYANDPHAQGTIALTKHVDFASVDGCEIEMP